MSTEHAGHGAAVDPVGPLEVDLDAAPRARAGVVGPRVPPGPLHPPGPPRVLRRVTGAALVAGAVLLGAWSGHTTGTAAGRQEGAREALAGSRVLLWFRGDGERDGPGRARLELFAASGSGRELRLLRVHVGADLLTPVQPLEVPGATSASSTAAAQVACGSARELELVRSAPAAIRTGTLVADVVDADGVEREAPVALLPDDASFRTVLRAAACPRAGAGSVPAGISIVAMTAQANGDLTVVLEAGQDASPARVRVVQQEPLGPWTVTTSPQRPVALVPGGPRQLLVVRIRTAGCVNAFGGQPSVEGLLALEVSTPGLLSRTRLPGWDSGAVGQAASQALQAGCAQ
jgi:hypothetical protein